MSLSVEPEIWLNHYAGEKCCAGLDTHFHIRRSMAAPHCCRLILVWKYNQGPVHRIHYVFYRIAAVY